MNRLRRLAPILHNPLARGLVVYLVIPNLAFYLLGQYILIDRVYVNTDYLVLWGLSLGLPRLAVCILYALLVDLDAVLSTESIYHFTTAETMALARELIEFKPLEFYAIGAALLLAVIVALGFSWRTSARRSALPVRTYAYIGLAALLVAGASALRAYAAPDERLNVFTRHAIVGSSIAEASLAGRWAEDAPQQVDDAAAAAAASAGEDRKAAGSRSPYDIVFVLVESQGLLKSKADMRGNLAPLLGPAIAARYRVSTGAVRFQGGTMFGELRSLCRIYAPQTTPQHLPGLDRCLPNLLRQRGYDTVSYHGYWRWFYERQEWYPALGFEHMHFAEDMMAGAPESAKCGSIFKGLCDVWIADQIENELVSSGATRKFIYWVTLNSHLPVDSEMAKGSSFDCARTETLKDEAGPCDLARIHYDLYARIARLALDPAIPPTRFLIVGDHMPPFPTLSERRLYDDKRVPYVDLVPRR